MIGGCKKYVDANGGLSGLPKDAVNADIDELSAKGACVCVFVCVCVMCDVFLVLL